MIMMSWKSAKRSFNLLLIAACLMAAIAFTPQAYAKTAESSKFELSIAKTEQQISVDVAIVEAVDLYAYDLILEYDPLKLKFIGENNDMPGFKVDPRVGGGQLKLAHTKVGPAPGANGTMLLTTLMFEQIRGGKSEIKLLKANLVDTELEMVQLSPSVYVEVATNQAVSSFTDIAGHWAEAAILESADLGFVNGFPDGAFRPDQQITRAEFTAMLIRALMMAESRQGDVDFVDSDSIPAWAVPYVKASVQAGLIKGYEDRTFRGGKLILRQEMASIVVRTMAGEQNAGPELNFSDKGAIQAWAQSDVASAVNNGLMQGKGNNRFAPLDNTTRAEAVTVILNLLRLQAK